MKKVCPATAPLAGVISVPGDKSIGHRALIFGALAEGELCVRNLPDGQDVESTRRCLEALGINIKDDRGSIVVKGVGSVGAFRAPPSGLDCGNSGTSMRLLMGVLAGQPFESTLMGDASLSRRPMGRVAEPLRRMKATITLSGKGFAPVRISGRSPLAAIQYALPVPSAQVKSALLLAALFADGESAIEDPFATRDHSERMLSWLGATIQVEGTRVRIRPSGLRSGRGLTIPGDISSAAYFLAAAAIVPDSEVTIQRVGINPTRMGFASVLQKMGALIEISEGGLNGGEPVGDIHARFGKLRGIHIKASDIPALVDEAPMIAVVACLAEGITRIEGLSELRHKESDRLSATAAGLRAMGAEATVEGDELIIKGPVKFKGARIETLGDHRLAMAFAIAALVAEGERELSDADCVAISYPSFFADLQSLVQ